MENMSIHSRSELTHKEETNKFTAAFITRKLTSIKANNLKFPINS